MKFTILKKYLSNVLGLENLNKDILLTLELLDKDRNYNVDGELLADDNTFSGIDIVRFGDNINVFLDRHLVEKNLF